MTTNSHSRGIWIICCRDDLSYQLIDSHPQIITFFVSKLQQVWYCFGVDASPNPVVRARLWDYFATLRTMVNGPWLIAGDMNEIIQPLEVSGRSFLLSRSLLFKDALDIHNFIDMPVVGGLFTWRKNTMNGGHVCKHLDRCTTNMVWHIKFPHMLVELLNRHCFDHNLLLISCHKAQSKHKSFHLQEAWLSHPLYA